MKKKKQSLQYDALTQQISGLMGKIPKAGAMIARIYLWQPMMFNFMIVGASGVVLSWLLYEQIFRSLLINFWGGTFIGMVITSILVFMWNYSWNKRWSLNMDAQIMKMKKQQLNDLKEKLERLLSEKFDIKGNRI